MQCTLIFILVISLISIEKIYSNENDDEEYSLYEKQINPSQCLLKNQIYKSSNRERRASISRPYFYHWRPTRDNVRYSSKNSLAFSPRLGKRNNENDLIDQANEYENFLRNFIDYLQEKQIYVIYEDLTKICLSQPITNEFFEQFQRTRRNQDDETYERQTNVKHPILFRYRLG